jgi:glutamyl-tRNA synthetase
MACPFNPRYDEDTIGALLQDFALKMPYGVDETTWWEGVKVIAGIHGFAPSNKEYKANPKTYIGNASDAAEILRIALTGSKDSPNLHEVIEILGKDVVTRRLCSICAQADSR